MSSEFVRIEDSQIIRDIHNGVEGAHVFDCDGRVVCSLPIDWTATQIHASLRRQNKAYALGFTAGQRAKASEIRRAIGAEEILAGSQS